jgi:hypothetical protein
VLLGVALVVASVCWNIARRPVTFALARSSVGCAGRTKLIASVVTELYPNFPPEGSQDWGLFPRLTSYALSTGRMVAWHNTQIPPHGTQSQVAKPLLHLADGRFQHLGSLRTQAWILPRPDSGGPQSPVMFALHYDAVDFRAGSGGGAAPMGCAVVRLEPPSAILTGLVVGTRTYPHWVGKNGDRATELEFVRWIRPQSGSRRIQTQIAGVFKLDENDVPVLQESLSSDEFLVWTPPDGQPVAIPEDIAADEFFRSLLEVPAGFGTTTSSAPAAPTSTRSSPP